jgi:hypothetical protein
MQSTNFYLFLNQLEALPKPVKHNRLKRQKSKIWEEVFTIGVLTTAMMKSQDFLNKYSCSLSMLQERPMSLMIFLNTF